MAHNVPCDDHVAIPLCMLFASVECIMLCCCEINVDLI